MPSRLFPRQKTGHPIKGEIEKGPEPKQPTIIVDCQGLPKSHGSSIKRARAEGRGQVYPNPFNFVIFFERQPSRYLGDSRLIHLMDFPFWPYERHLQYHEATYLLTYKPEIPILPPRKRELLSTQQKEQNAEEAYLQESNSPLEPGRF
jgi:hypothetical protein